MVILRHLMLIFSSSAQLPAAQLRFKPHRLPVDSPSTQFFVYSIPQEIRSRLMTIQLAFIH